MPLFSVIIPLYNKERDIEDTIRTVLQQDLEDFELIIVDDGSTDNSLDVVKAIDDRRIRVISKQNEGVAPTRNLGVEKARAELVAFLDADDLWLPHHLSDLDKLAKQQPEVKWYATAYRIYYHKNLSRPLYSPVMERNDWFGKIDNYFSYSLTESIVWTSAVCFRKSFFEDLGGFDSSITHGAGEDTDLWIRAALASPLGYSSRISAVYNLEGSNRISLTPTRKRRFLDPDRYEINTTDYPDLKKFLDLNRYSIGLQHKIADDTESYRRCIAQLDRTNLNSKQRLLLNLPGGLIKFAVGIQELASRMGIHLSPFK